MRELLDRGHAVVFIASDAGRQVLGHELGIELPDRDATQQLLESLSLDAGSKLRHVSDADLFDAVCSGTRAPDATIVAPCSMGTLGAIAAGTASTLIERVADVALKERKKLILVPRETPLSLVHLRNLTALAEAGAVVLPAMPGFYHRPETIDDLVNHVAGKVLDILGIEHDLFSRWGE